MADANTGDLSQNIRDQFLQCKICLDGLKEPKTLPCLHTFCAECIHYYIGHNKIDERKFACPICRRHIYIPKHGVDGFPDSFFVTNLNDMVLQQSEAIAEQEIKSSEECGICKFKDTSVTACSLCVECKINLCEECGKSHSTAKITNGHTLLPIQQQSACSFTRENYCRSHKGETIKFYCETCNACICLPCTFLDHKDHEITEIKEVIEEFSKDMSALVMQSADNIIQLQSVKEDMNDLENELFVRKESVKSEIRRKTQDIVRKLQDQESRLTIEVDEFYETIAVARDRQRVERTIYRLEHAHDFAKQLLSPETSPIHQLTNRKEAKENLERSVSYELPDVMQHAQKLDKYIHFLPGKLDIALGTLLKCTTAGQSNTISDTREVIPSTKALFAHKLIPSNGVMGQVMALSFLPNGNIAILTNLAKKVRIYNSKGQLKYEFGDDEELQHPSDMVLTRDGEIAITDCGLLCVKIFDQFGTVMGQFGGDEIFSLPMSITVDKVGKFIVCDQEKKRITVHRSTGYDIAYEFNIPEVQTPQVIAYQDDKLYICDPDHGSIHMYSYQRDELQYVAKLSAHDAPRDAAAATDADADAHFFDCSAMTVDKTGNILITDTTTDRINVFNPKGELSQITAYGKQFLQPSCIAVSRDGLVAVAQRGKYMECVEGDEQPQPGVEQEHAVVEEEVEEVEVSNEVCIYRLLRVDV